MAFGDRLRGLRITSGMSQQKLADEMKISLRTVQNYESGKRYPKNMGIVKRAADALCTTTDELLGEEDYSLLDAEERGGIRARRDIQVLASQVAGLFAGGDLEEDDRDAAMRAITEAYWKAKEENQKYTPKKYRG